MNNLRIKGVIFTYKITLLDYNTPAFCTFTFESFVDDIEEFQKRWFKLETEQSRKDNFLRSKNGEIVTESYENTNKYNIVQYDENCKIYKSCSFEENDFDIDLHNGWDCANKYHIKNLKVDIRWVRFQEYFYKIAKYKIHGIARYDEFGEFKFSVASCHGNNILEENKKSKKYSSDDFIEYENDVIEAIVYLPIDVFEDEDELLLDLKNENLTNKEIDALLMDIPGEAG